MAILAFDTETALFGPGNRAPALVCVTWQRPGLEPKIVHHADALPTLKEWLAGDDLLIGHNVAYDMAVIAARFPALTPFIFEKYAAGQITDTLIREQLIRICLGQYRGFMRPDGEWQEMKYSLDDCVYRLRGTRLDKDTWRLRYAEFLSVPLCDWPEGARTYPLEDARATLDVYLDQEKRASQIDTGLPYVLGKYGGAVLADQYRQSRAAFALHLASCWGMRTDPDAVDIFARATSERYAQCAEFLRSAGLVRSDGTADTKAAQEAMAKACEEAGITPVATGKGAISLSSAACERITGEDGEERTDLSEAEQVIATYSRFLTLRKVLSNDVEMLKMGTVYPIHPSYGMADTGRTTCRGPNIQALRRAKGIRDAFRPRSGHVFAQADYEGLELHTLAQWCLTVIGESALAKQLNAGIDIHMAFAADMIGLPYDEAKARKKDPAIKEARQAAKAANFGFPGGLGIDKFRAYAKATFGVELSPEQAQTMKDAWLGRFPEMTEFFAISARATRTGDGIEEHIFSRRIRGGVRYTALCNGRFQGLGADAAKEAVWRVQRACFTDRHSPLYGSHAVAFVHDEIIVEVPDNASSHDAAQELGRLMKEGANVYLPDVPAKLEPLLMRMWSKDAEPVYDDSKRLVPWSPK